MIRTNPTDRTDCTTRPSIARRILRSRMSAAITAAALTASVAGGVAYAATGPIDGEGTIHACYNAASGAMKLLTANSTCPKSASTPISWNQHGAAGPQGIQGPEGPQGPQGAAGGLSANDVVAASASNVAMPGCWNACHSTYTELAAAPRPAGSYLVSGDVDFTIGTTWTAAGFDTSSIACWVGTTNSGSFPYNAVHLAPMPATGAMTPGSHVNVSINTVVTLSQSGPLGLYCDGETFTWNAITGSASMTAVRLH